jgi:hypothetical protein
MPVLDSAGKQGKAPADKDADEYSATPDPTPARRISF